MLRCRYSDIVPGDMLIDVSHSTYKCGRKTWYLVLERSRPTSDGFRAKFNLLIVDWYDDSTTRVPWSTTRVSIMHLDWSLAVDLPPCEDAEPGRRVFVYR